MSKSLCANVLKATATLTFLISSLLISTQSHARDSMCALQLHYFDENEYNYPYPRRWISDFENCLFASIGVGSSHMSPEGETNGWYSDDSQDLGIKLSIGNYFNPNWFWEFSYAELGTAGLTNDNAATLATIPEAGIEYRVPALFIGYWFRPRFTGMRIYTKAGLSAIQNRANDDRIGYEEQTTIQLALGIGIQRQIGRGPWYGRLEIDSYDRDASWVGISVGRFFDLR